MKCPKCGYNSFDHLDSCKKCGKDLVEFKERFGIRSILFPGGMRPIATSMDGGVSTGNVAEVAVAAAVTASVAPTAPVAADVDDTETLDDDFNEMPTSGEDDFGFDFMGESEEEEDLSFDELFDEAPADEDVEETLPAPDAASEADIEEEIPASDDFSFDSSDEDDVFAEPSAEVELDEDFGFDLDVEGDEEDPKDPFDYPGTSQDEEDPASNVDLFDSSLVLASEAVAEDDLFSPSGADDSADINEPEKYVFEVIEEWDAETGSSDRIVESPSSETNMSSVVEPAGSVAPHFDTVDAIAAAAFSEVSETEEMVAEYPLFPAEDTVVEDGISANLVAEDEVDENSAYGATEDSAKILSAALLPELSRRIGAFCCDLLLLISVAICFVVAAEAAMSAPGAELLPTLETLVDLSIPYFLVLFSLAFGYFTLFHFLAGQTPGKMVTGLRVETVDGEPLVISQAFLRSVGGLLQLLPAGLGCLAILSSSDRRGWNDRLAGTRLIALKGLVDEG